MTDQPDLLESAEVTLEPGGKPPLPDLPSSVTEREYKPSGEYTSGSIVRMLGLGIPSSLVITLIAIPVGLLVIAVIALLLGLWGGIGAFLSGVTGCLGVAYFIATFVPIGGPLLLAVIAYPFVYPGVVGAVIGEVTWRLAKAGKCRNPNVAGIIGFVNATLGYVGLQLLSILVLGTVKTVGSIADIAIFASRTTSELSFDALLDTLGSLDSFGIAFQNTPGWVYVILVIEALIFVALAAVMANDGVSKNPFCEKCQKWYVESAKGAFTATSAGPLIQSLSTDNPAPLSDVYVTSEEQYPHLIATLKECPSCESADYHLALSLGWEEVEIKNNEKKVKQKSEDWVATMVAPGVGQELEQLLPAAKS